MTIALSGRLTLREVMEQAWQQVEGRHEKRLDFRFLFAYSAGGRGNGKRPRGLFCRNAG
jgi:hypothetical protein